MADEQEIMELMLSYFPKAQLGLDEDGQYVIYTNLTQNDAGDIVDMDTGKKW